METSETIVAIATPAGTGAIGVVRVSGPQALPIAGALTCCESGPGKAPVEDRRMHRRMIRDKGETIDQALVVIMRGPKSYTGEDVVEFHCHGGRIVLQRVVRACMDHGARPAEPGEFSKRAFLNGKMELSQAEAVIDLIQAKSEGAARLAVEQMTGRAGIRLKEMRDAIGDIAAEIEARIDFPEEEIPPLDRVHMDGQLKIMLDTFATMSRSYDTAHIIREGLRVVIAGKPNAGKSSIFNALVRAERAIVTEDEGTTRDLLEECIVLHGRGIVLADTAGICDGEESAAGREGIRRSREAVRGADFVILVLDGSRAWSQRDAEIASLMKGKIGIVAINKSDLPGKIALQDISTELKGWPRMDVSAWSGAGIETVLQRICSVCNDHTPGPSGSVIISNIRHKQLIDECIAALGRAQALCDTEEDHLAMLELTRARRAIDEITGETATDDLLERIFSRFCIGK